MAIDYSAAQFWFTVVQLIITLTGWAYAWWTNRNKVNNARFKELEGKIVEVEKKAANPICANHMRMEKADVELFQQIREMHGDIREMAGSMKSAVQTLKMVQQHLITKEK